MKSLKYIVALALAAGLFQACDLERYPLSYRRISVVSEKI